MATIKSPMAKKARPELKATSGRIVTPASVALAADSGLAKSLLDLIKSHAAVDAERCFIQDVSERRTDLLVTLKPAVREDGTLDTAAFDAGAAYQFAVDALASMDLEAAGGIGTSHPRFVLRDIRVRAPVEAAG